jgi:hypothetical protein
MESYRKKMSRFLTYDANNDEKNHCKQFGFISDNAFALIVIDNGKSRYLDSRTNSKQNKIFLILYFFSNCFQ